MPGDENEKFESMDPDSLKFLEDVRKGKARNYVLSAKGPKVRSLVVKKKRVKPDEIKQARGGGFQPMFGVVEGQAANITFYIARIDGFEEDPLGGKVVKLKEFLKSQTGKAFKPEVKLVEFPPAIPFDESDLQDPLIARFMKLAPAVSEVCDNNPDQVALLEGKTREIRELLQDEETRSQAEPPILELEEYLRSFSTTSEAPESLPESPPTTGGNNESMDEGGLAAKLAALLTKLKPLYQQAVAKAPDQQEALKEAMTKLVLLIKNEQFEEAKTEIPGFAAQLKNIVGAPKTVTEVDYSAWKPVRDHAVNSLKQVAKEIAEENHPQSKDAIIELKAVLSNLTAEPSTMNQVSELERYLMEDDVVNDVCELAEDIRTPLMNALAEMKVQFST